VTLQAAIGKIRQLREKREGKRANVAASAPDATGKAKSIKLFK